METNTALDERAFQLAKDDAMAASAPRGTIFATGFLSAMLITWLPLVVYLVIFVWDALFGTVTFGDSKFAAAAATLGSNVGNYAGAVWMYSIVAGLFGMLLAFLRALSAQTNMYVHIPTRDRDMRLGVHQLVGLVGVPIILGVVISMMIENRSAFYILFVLIVVSGLFFNIVFQAIQNALLRRMHRPDPVQQTVAGLKLFIPRLVGHNHAQVTHIDVDGQQRMATVYGTFDSDATRREVQQIAGHFLRGYAPIHVRDAEQQAS